MTYELTVNCALWTVNAERAMFWRKHRTMTTGVRWSTKIAALHAKVPRLDRVSIVVEPLQSRRGPAADVGAYSGPAKAAIDGLRDAHVLVDDTDRYVSSIQYLPSRRVDAKDVGLVLYLTPVEPSA